VSSPAGAPRDLQFHHVLTCPCGDTLTGATEDEIVEVACSHLRGKHPEMAGDYERDHILAMAQRLVRPDPSGPPDREKRGP
jgi:hypothetical protein